jgi:hypothetical protein
MVIQNKSDNCNGHALKWSNFRLDFEDVYLRNVPISWEMKIFANNFRETNIFRSTKFRENLLILASFSLFVKNNQILTFL